MPTTIAPGVTPSALRANPDDRNDFLEILLRENRIAINSLARRANADRDFAQNDCAQAFLISANRAIDTAREEGHIRNVAGWCKFKGLRGVQDFVRREMGAEDRFHQRAVITRTTISVADVSVFAHPDPTDYAELVASLLDVTTLLDNLRESDRKIVSLIVFGHDGENRLKYADGEYGAPRRHALSRDLASTLNLTERAVYERLIKIRKRLKKEIA